MHQTLIDLGTLRSAYALLNRRTSGSAFFSIDEDSHLVALSTLVEGIVLSDQVVVPGVPHMSGETVASLFGEAIVYRPLDQHLYCELEREAISWAVENISVADMLDAINVELSQGIGGGSDYYTVETTFGFDRKRVRSHLGLREKLNDGLECRTDIEYGINIPTHLDSALKDRYDEMRRLASEKIHADRLPGRTPLRLLYWILVRCRCYDMISRYWKLAYTPHPFRARATLLSRSYDAVDGSTSNPYMTAIDSVLQEGREFVHGSTGGVLTPMASSPVFEFVLSRCKQKADLLPKAYELRDASGPRACRRHLAQHTEALHAGDYKEALKLSSAINKLKNYLRAEIGIPIAGDPITIGIYAASVPLPKRLTALTASKIESLFQPQTLFIKNVFREVSRVAKLGNKYEMLTRGRDVMPSHALRWSRAEIGRHVAYQYKTNLAAGIPPNRCRAMALDLVRQADPQLALSEGWKIVKDETYTPE